jgi:hypothetical protein
VTGKQVKESTLGTVPHAVSAQRLPAAKPHNLKLINGWVIDADYVATPRTISMSASSTSRRTARFRFGTVQIWNAVGAPSDNPTHYTRLDGVTFPTR